MTIIEVFRYAGRGYSIQRGEIHSCDDDKKIYPFTGGYLTGGGGIYVDAAAAGEIIDFGEALNTKETGATHSRVGVE